MSLTASVVAPISAGDIAVYAAKTGVIVAFLCVGFRFLGKRQMAQLTVYDLVMLMAVSNAVQNAMTGGRGNLPVGLSTSTVVLATAWVLTRALARHPAADRRVIGSPTLLVLDGKVFRDRMRRQLVTRAELGAALRAHGLEGPGQVHLAVLEVDGSISVVAREARPGRRSQR